MALPWKAAFLVQCESESDLFWRWQRSTELNAVVLNLVGVGFFKGPKNSWISGKCLPYITIIVIEEGHGEAKAQESN